jgi:hypothetical protein
MRGAVALDSNLLLLFVVGSASVSYIEKHKRLQHVFTEDHFVLLLDLLAEYSSLILLPNTLTETSNLSRQIAEPARSAIARTMRLLIERSTETFVASAKAAGRGEFLKLGLTDAVLLELAGRESAASAITLLTTDLELAIAAEIAGYAVVNFNHYRDM